MGVRPVEYFCSNKSFFDLQSNLLTSDCHKDELCLATHSCCGIISLKMEVSPEQALTPHFVIILVKNNA